MPEIWSLVSVINFSVPCETLEEQLILDLILSEKPEIDTLISKKSTEIYGYKKQMRDIEMDILNKLTNATDEIILNTSEFVTGLDKNKTNLGIIGKSLEEANSTSKEIEKTKGQYREIAARGSLLFSVIGELSKVNPMYQYSYSQFIKIFYESLLNIGKKENIIDTITKRIFYRITRGLFDCHKLLFAFLIATRIKLKTREISTEEFNLLLQIAAKKPIKKAQSSINPLPNMITDIAWQNICSAEAKIKGFSGIIESITKSSLHWVKYLTSGISQDLLLPDGFDEKLTKFNKVLLMGILKQSQLIQSCKEYIENILGKAFTEIPVQTLSDLFAVTTNKYPIIIIQGPGVDSITPLISYAQEKKSLGIGVISLGKEQELKSEKELNDGKKTRPMDNDSKLSFV